MCIRNKAIEDQKNSGYIISVGDRVPEQSYSQIHSRFDNAINFVFNEQIISLVTPKIDPGPFRIVVDNMELHCIMQMQVNPNNVILNQKMDLPFNQENVYSSIWVPDNLDMSMFLNNLQQLETLLLAQDNKDSLSFLLQAESDLFNPGSFEQELSRQMRQAYAKLLQNNIVEAVIGFKGRGYGQTPSGDDFNTGLLMGLKFRQQLEKKELSKITSSIYTHSLGKNLLVNTFLLQAYNGWYNENWKNLLTAITGQKMRLEDAVQQILAQGFTSGADTLTGFLTAWKIDVIPVQAGIQLL